MPEITPDATPRIPREEQSAIQLAAIESAWIRNYFAAQIEDLHRLNSEREMRYEQRFLSQEITVREKAAALRNNVEAAASALALQTSSTDKGLMDHIISQEKSTRLAQESLKELLAEKDKAVNMAALNASRAQQEFKDQILTRLDILNGHETEIGSLTGTLTPKDQFYILRDQVLVIDARSADNAKDIAGLTTSPVEQTTMRLRIEALEQRPLAWTTEEHLKTQTAIVELKTETRSLSLTEHDLRNQIELIRDRPGALTQVEIDDIRRALRAWLKADVSDPLTNIEVTDVRSVLRRNSTRGRRLTLAEAALISAIIFTVIAAVVTAIITHVH